MNVLATTTPQESEAQALVRRFERIRGMRGTWESHWREIAERIIPRMVDSFFGQQNRWGGSKNTSRMIDVTAAKALDKFAAILESMLTPRSSTWHKLTSTNPELNRIRAVKVYFEDVNRILFEARYAAESNFPTAQSENYISLGAFGTGVKFVEAPRERGKRGLRYRCVPLSEFYAVTNYHGRIDTCFRLLTLSARQAAQRFPLDRLPPKLQLELAQGKDIDDQRWEFIHYVAPREDDYDPDRIDARGMPIKSCYVALENKALLQEGGFETWPFPVGRYVTGPGEVYGRSPAMMALGSIGTLNEMKIAFLKQGHRAVDPVLLAYDDGVVDTFNMRPGAINPGGVNADGRPLVQPLPIGNLAVSDEMMAAEKADINDFFLVNLFQILMESPEMSATEVVERTREKAILLSPHMGRQQTEDLGPLIEREIDLLARQGLLPPQPPELREAAGEYQIGYDSPFARAQKSEQVTGFMRTTEFAVNVAQATGDNTVINRLNFEAALPEIAAIQGAPSHWIRSDDEMAEIAERSQQQQEIATAIEAAPAAAGVMKAMAGMQGGGGGKRAG